MPAKNDVSGQRKAAAEGEHILAGLSSSPSNARIIRAAARMAAAFHGRFTALYVEPAEAGSIPAEDKKRLQQHIRLAEELGAKIETAYGDDVAFQIAEFSRVSGVSKVVVGRSTARRSFFFAKPNLVEQLMAYAPSLDLYVIPDSAAPEKKDPRPSREAGEKLSWADTAKSLLVLALATALGCWFKMLGFSEDNIITVYILSVLITAVVTNRRVYSLVSSLVGVLIFNFLFTIPQYSLRAYGSGYPVTFLIMFLSALISSSLAAQMKRNARQSALAAYRTRVLLDTSQLIQKAKNKEEIAAAAAGQLVKLLRCCVVFYPAEKGRLLEPVIYTEHGGPVNQNYISRKERDVAAWVMKHNRRAGASTDTMSGAACYYLAVRVNENVYGVAGLALGGKLPDAFENNIVFSILGECALAMERNQMAIEKEEAAVLAKNEQLRANLLRSISHDLRTPLTAISGNASNLFSNGESFDAATKKQIYADIYDDALWLINLVENLLAVSRINEGQIKLNLTNELIDEVIEEALQHVNRKSVEHQIIYTPSEEFFMAKMDARLMVQVVINIVDNAIKYTQPGSEIVIATKKKQDWLEVSVADNGPGIEPEAKPHVFDMFYTGANKVADSRRSLGLGLSLCKSIVEAHGGEICVRDNVPQGTVFTFTLKAEEVRLHE